MFEAIVERLLRHPVQRGSEVRWHASIQVLTGGFDAEACVEIGAGSHGLHEYLQSRHQAQVVQLGRSQPGTDGSQRLDDVFHLAGNPRRIRWVIRATQPAVQQDAQVQEIYLGTGQEIYLGTG